MSESTSSNYSSSSSSPIVEQTPENDLMNAISGVASGLANQMESWAQGVFAQTSAVTDQAVGNFMNASTQMMGLAGNMTNQYNQEFAPENQDLINDANEYASTSRMQTDMGQAGATQAQAGDQAIKNSEANLVSMGIDPSSGRYAALDKAAAVQNAANVAGAENTQRNADTTTGQALRSEAVQVGAQLPSAITNATNASTQANTAAANASDANANTGANLNALANSYLQTAMSIKMPLQGQVSASNSAGNSQSSGPGKQSGSSPSGSGAGGGGGNSNGGFNPGMGPNTAAMGSDGTSGGGSQPSSKISHPTDAQQNQTGDMSNPEMSAASREYNDDIYGPNGAMTGVDEGQWENQPGGSGSMGIGEAGDTWDQSGAGGGTPFDDGGFGQTYDPSGGSDGTFGGMSGGTDTPWGNISYNPSGNDGGFGDFGQQANTDTSDTEAGSSSVDDNSQPSPPSDQMGQQEQDGLDDYNSDQDDGSAGDTSQDDYQDAGQDYSDDSDFAGGGLYNGGVSRPAAPRMPQMQARPQATTGGAVRPSMSPSGGARTDDVNAHLNADEFVLPKDVVKWKGEEFMHKLIADSRMKRQKMAAALGTGGKPSQGPKPSGPPTFTSHPMGR